MNPKALWEKCREVIRQNVSIEQYNISFAYAEYKSYADGELILSIPSQFIYEMLEKDEYVKLIRSTLTQVFGENVRLSYSIPVVNKIPGGKINVKADGQPGAQNGKPLSAVEQSASAPNVPDLDSQLHRGYSFENYLEGESNRLARSVGEAVAQKPAHTFNPFFIFGPSGCGKTHLVNAVGWRVKQLHPELRVLYLSAHLFTVQYTDAVRKNKVNDFINFYQTIDVLIIDDIQEFSGKSQTQNTFFHIFNHLHLNNRQLILTADRPPVKIEGLEDRLLTRFKWGLQAEIEKPPKLLRRSILLNKVRKEGLNIPENVIDYISDHIDESVRDLEGIITSLMAYSVVYSCNINMKLVSKMMPRFVKEDSTEDRRITIEDIKRHVCEYFNVKEEVMCSRSRKQEIVFMRQLAIYLANKHTDLSTVQIGLKVGGRNHATILHSIRQVKNLLDTDGKTRTILDELESTL